MTSLLAARLVHLKSVLKIPTQNDVQTQQLIHQDLVRREEVLERHERITKTEQLE